jgi:hypothetical protein
VPDSITATNTLWQMTALTGGAAGALDSIDGGSLLHNDRAFCIVAGAFSVYWLNANSGQTESSPNVIAPDTTAGLKRWILCT